MDPDACLQRWRDAKEDGDEAEALAAALDLISWIASGGFEPLWYSQNERHEVMCSC